MGLFDRLFPGRDVRTALQSISELENALPSSLGLHLGFDGIKASLRNEIIQKPDELRLAIQTTNYSIKVLVLIRARNIIWDELESGRHQTFGTRKTMTGDGLVALHGHFTALLEEAGAETSEEAQASRASLRDMIKMHFGFE
jgi:hypothetical protein